MRMAADSAFPFPPQGDTGLTVREWYAGMAIAGILATNPTVAHPDNLAKLAKLAYRMADAMIDESNVVC